MKNEWLVRLSSELDVTSNPRGAPLESFPSVDYSFMCLHDARNYKPQRKGLTRSHVCTVHVGICGTSAALLMSHISAQHKQASYQHKHTHTQLALLAAVFLLWLGLWGRVCVHIYAHTHTLSPRSQVALLQPRFAFLHALAAIFILWLGLGLDANEMVAAWVPPSSVLHSVIIAVNAR